MTTNVLVSAPYVASDKRVRIETYDPRVAEQDREYTLVVELAEGQCTKSYGPTINDGKAIRITEVDAPVDPALSVDPSAEG